MARTSAAKANGKITIDLSKVTHREFAAFWREGETDENRDAFLVKVCGLTEEQLENLPETEWREFRRELMAVSFPDLKGTTEKNSHGAST